MASTSAIDRLAAILCDIIVGLVRRDGVDLSARQLAVLLICYLENGPHTVRGLAERLNVAKPAITRALDRLETSSLARRAPDPRDRRSVLVARTPAGAAYVAMLRGVMQAAARANGAREERSSHGARRLIHYRRRPINTGVGVCG